MGLIDRLLGNTSEQQIKKIMRRIAAEIEYALL